jgi:hypothetical protein
MKPSSMQVGLRSIIYPITFVWNNIPSLTELTLYSSVQALVEVVFNVDKSFGSNPIEKSFIRDGAKIPGEIPLAYANSPYGKTQFWHDEFSLTAIGMKPLLKGSLMAGYKASFSLDIESYTAQYEQLIEAHNSSVCNKIPSNVKDLWTNKDFKEVLGGGARFSNFVGEPFARVVDGVSKKYQTNLVNLHGDEAISKQGVGAYKVVEGFKQHGLEVIPFGLTSAFMKVVALDYIGKKYGTVEIEGTTVKNWFKYLREDIIEEELVAFVDMDSGSFKRLSFYEKKDVIFYQENLSDAMKYSVTASVFVTEVAEKTLYNMLTMTVLSTPNKAIGNVLYALDEYAPMILRPVGMAAGAYYVKSEFFNTKKKELSLSEFAKKSDIQLTQEEVCYVDFIDYMRSIEVEPEQRSEDAFDIALSQLSGCLAINLEG